MRYPIPFGRHLLLERINVGGMAEVFKAKSFGVEGFERIVAVKRILPALAEDEEFVTMFIDEARIASHLTHQNIVQIYELGRTEGTYFISMEYVAGKDLRQILDQYKKSKELMDIGRSCFIVSRVCEAMEHAHRKRDAAGRDLKIIHRDVTPQNVILSYEGEVKLCDFGIAKAASRASRTQVGVLKGKFAYMSPEQVRGLPTDRRSDLFALGVIFYEMLTGERLFLGESDYSTLEAVRNARVPTPTQYNTKIPPNLEAIVLKLLTQEPEDRYQWASEVQEDLLRHLMKESKPYQTRQLRAFMQSRYRHDIAIENAKLDDFMRLKHPEDTGPESAPPVVQRAPSADEPKTDTSMTPPSVVPAEAGALMPPPSVRYAPDAVQPNNTSENVPISGISALPSVDPLPDEDDDETIAISPSSERDPTPLDMPKGSHGPSSSRSKGEDEGLLEQKLSAAQARLIRRLDEAGALQEGNTIDASEMHDESGVPKSTTPKPLRAQQPPDAQATERPKFRQDGMPYTVPPRAAKPEPRSAPQGVPSALPEGPPPPGGRVLWPPSTEMMARTPREITKAHLKPKGSRSTGKPTSGRGHPAGTVPLGQLIPDDDDDEALTTYDNRLQQISHHPRTQPGSDDERQDTPREGRRPTPLERGRPATSPNFLREPGAEQEDQAISEPDRPPEAILDAAPIGVAAGLLRDPRVLMLIASLVGLLAIVMLVVLILTHQPTVASLQIVTNPTKEVMVWLDGDLVGHRTPVDIDSLEIGTHRLLLRAEGYEVYTQTIQISEAKPHTMVIPLEWIGHNAPPPPEPLPVPKEDKTSTPPKDPEDSGSKTEKSPDSATERGAHGLAHPERRSKDRSPRKRSGFLMVSTAPPGVALLIDGKRTQLRTPVQHPHPISAGKHVLTFEMNGGRSYSFDIHITPGKTLRFHKTLR